jgi:hypothetical protein
VGHEISRLPNHGLVPSVRSTGSHAAWLNTVPKAPGEVPIRAIILPPNTRGISAGVATANRSHS